MRTILVTGGAKRIGKSIVNSLAEENNRILIHYNNSIEEAQKLRDAGMKAHDSGDHAKSEELLSKALGMFKG